MRHLNPTNHARARSLARGVRRGFTLIEAALVTVIIGVGVVGMLELLAVGTETNSDGTELTTAMNLANNVREIALGMDFYDPQDTADGSAERPKTWNTKEATVKDYDNVLDLDDCVFNPPLNGMRDPMDGYKSWTQIVKVESVFDENLASVAPQDTPREPTARVTVIMWRGQYVPIDPTKGKEIYRMSFLAAAPKELPD